MQICLHIFSCLRWVKTLSTENVHCSNAVLVILYFNFFIPVHVPLCTLRRQGWNGISACSTHFEQVANPILNSVWYWSSIEILVIATTAVGGPSAIKTLLRALLHGFPHTGFAAAPSLEAGSRGHNTHLSSEDYLMGDLNTTHPCRPSPRSSPIRAQPANRLWRVKAAPSTSQGR